MAPYRKSFLLVLCGAALVAGCDDGGAASSQLTTGSSGDPTSSGTGGTGNTGGQGGTATGGSGTGGTTGTGGTSVTTSGTGGNGNPSLQHVWSKRFGDAANQRVRAADVAPNTNVVLCGDLDGNIDFGGGNLTAGVDTDLFLARFDGDGNHIWSAAFGDVGASSCDVATDTAGNTIVGGEFYSVLNLGGSPLVSAGERDIFVAKFSSAGAHLWSKSFGDPSAQFAPSIAVDSTGAVIVTGIFEGTLNFGGSDLVSQGTYDIYVAKFDASGSHIWSVRAGDSGNQRALDVAVDQIDNIYLVGAFTDTLDFGTPLTSLGGNDAFVVKLNPNNNYLWGKRFGDSAYQDAIDVSVSPSGSVAISGTFKGTIDLGGGSAFSPDYTSFFLAEYDSTGAYLWNTTQGSSQSEHAATIGSGAAASIVLAGAFYGTLDSPQGMLTNTGTGADVFLALLGEQGVPLWAQSYGSAAHDSPTEIAVANGDTVFLATTVEGPADLGGGELPYAGGMDVVLSRYTLNPIP